MRVLEVQWSRPLSLVCEVALISLTFTKPMREPGFKVVHVFYFFILYNDQCVFYIARV